MLLSPPLWQDTSQTVFAHFSDFAESHLGLSYISMKIILPVVAVAAALALASCSSSTPQSRIEKHSEIYNELSVREQELVAQGQIEEGMAPGGVFLALGSPDNRLEGSSEGTRTMRWDYTSLTPIYTSSFYGGFGYGGGFGGFGGALDGVAMEEDLADMAEASVALAASAPPFLTFPPAQAPSTSKTTACTPISAPANFPITFLSFAKAVRSRTAFSLSPQEEQSKFPNIPCSRSR